MTIMESIDLILSAPARKLSDYAHARKRGADVQLAVEIYIASNIAIVFSACALGQYFFAILATVFFTIFLKIGGWRPEMQALRPPENDINRFLKMIIAIFGTYTIINANKEEDVMMAIMGTAFLLQLLGDQMLTYRQQHG